MCTSFLYRRGGGYFGRNLDLDEAFGERVIITPRNYRFSLKNGSVFLTGKAMIGMAAQAGSYPLYAEAVNEDGLAMAGLNFPGNAVCHPFQDGMQNITPYELVPWVLGQASTVDEAAALLAGVSLLDVPFAEQMPIAPLHFMIADRTRSIVAEPVAEGLKLYPDPYNVMTNNPPFPYHDWNMRNYRHLGTTNEEQRFANAAGDSGFLLQPYAEGMGGIGLPGDASSASRFVRTSFALANSTCEGDVEDHVEQVFHILASVAMTRGTVRTGAGTEDITRYSCCISLADGTYYYRTYGNSRITAVRFPEVLRSAEQITVYPLRTKPDFLFED